MQRSSFIPWRLQLVILLFILLGSDEDDDENNGDDGGGDNDTPKPLERKAMMADISRQMFGKTDDGDGSEEGLSK